MSYTLAELGEISKGLFSPKPGGRRATRAVLRANKKAARQRAIAAGAAHPRLHAMGESATTGAMGTASAKATDWVNNPNLDQRVRDLGAKAVEPAAEKIPELSTVAGRNASAGARENAIPNKRKLLTLGIGGGAAFGAGTATVPWAAREVKRRKQALLGGDEGDNTQPNYG